MIPWLGALLIALGLRAGLRRLARYAPPCAEETPADALEVAESPPAAGWEVLPARPPRWAAPLLCLTGAGVMSLCDSSRSGAWALFLVGVAVHLAARRSAAASNTTSKKDESRGLASESRRRALAARRVALRIDLLLCSGLPLLLPGALAFVRARTWRGAAFALLCLALPLALGALVGNRAALARGLGLASLSLGLWLWALVPRSDPGRIESRFTGGPLPATWTPAALVPEEDQFQLGSFVVPLLDPYVDFAQSIRIRRAFGDIYDRVAADPDFQGLPSVVSASYLDMAGLQPLPRHLYLYVPAGRPGPRPVILFLHGSFGSFQGYLKALRPLADAGGYALVAPSFGTGLWQRADGLERVEEALDLCRSDPRLDAERVVAVGISAGGRAVTRAGQAFPTRLRGLAYISPVMEPELLHHDPFRAAWRGRPVLIVHGSEDRRLPKWHVERGVSALRESEVDLRLEWVAGEEHFLFFSQTSAVLDPLEAWCQAAFAR